MNVKPITKAVLFALAGMAHGAFYARFHMGAYHSAATLEFVVG